jgi:hypothetical protein
MTKATTYADETLSVLWTRSRLMHEAARANPQDEDGCEAAIALETKILRQPIGCTADAIAKLRAVQLAFHEGPRADGAEIVALTHVIDWLAGVRAPRSAEA